MQKRIHSRGGKFMFSLKPEAEEVLLLWKNGHRAEFTQLVMRFTKLHYAINAQKEGEGTGLEELKRSLTQGEDDMLDWYLGLAQDLIPRIQDGYGGTAALSAYHKAVDMFPQYKENYRRLRGMFDRFLDVGYCQLVRATLAS